MIEASTVKVSTMADSTLRIVLDIEPRHAQEAFALFGMRGAPCVIARLTQEAATAAQQAETIAGNTVSRVEDEKPVGGDLARLAARFCNDHVFRDWIGLGSPERAADYIRELCGIKSRAELDHDPLAAQIFHESIRKPFADWCRARGIA